MKSLAFWILAFLITISAAIYQRMTGPTYPLRGTINIENSEIKYKLERSHGGQTDHQITVKVENPEFSGYLTYKRFKTADSLTTVPMTRNDDLLSGYLPGQPAAGKLEYYVYLVHNGIEKSLTADTPVVIRFKGEVPGFVLIPHIIVMFLAIMISTRAGLEALNPKRNPRNFAIWATALLFVGGMIFGPIVQKYAFDAFWTGFPFGHDLTDNKTLIAMIGWIVAIFAGRKGKPARWWVLLASILLLAVYLIPHSVLGSELDYSQMENH